MVRLVLEDQDVTLHPGERDKPTVVLLPGLIAGSWIWQTTRRRFFHDGSDGCHAFDEAGEHERKCKRKWKWK